MSESDRHIMICATDTLLTYTYSIVVNPEKRSSLRKEVQSNYILNICCFEAIKNIWINKNKLWKKIIERGTFIFGIDWNNSCWSIENSIDTRPKFPGSIFASSCSQRNHLTSAHMIVSDDQRRVSCRCVKKK